MLCMSNVCAQSAQSAQMCHIWMYIYVWSSLCQTAHFAATCALACALWVETTSFWDFIDHTRTTNYEHGTQAWPHFKCATWCKVWRKIKLMVVSDYDTHLNMHLYEILVKSGCRARRLQHMVVKLVPSGATKNVQKWDTSMTHLRTSLCREHHTRMELSPKWYQIQRRFAHFDNLAVVGDDAKCTTMCLSDVNRHMYIKLGTQRCHQLTTTHICNICS